MRVRTKLIIVMLIMASASCEVDTKLTVEGGNPPKFLLSGSGTLSRLVIRGYKTLRKIEGPDASAFWYIETRDAQSLKSIRTLGPITYGQVPEGYVQVYPERGTAPQLEENEVYYVEVNTNGANGADGFFIIKDGKIRFAKYESQLKDS